VYVIVLSKYYYVNIAGNARTHCVRQLQFDGVAVTRIPFALLSRQYRFKPVFYQYIYIYIYIYLFTLISPRNWRAGFTLFSRWSNRQITDRSLLGVRILSFHLVSNCTVCTLRYGFVRCLCPLRFILSIVIICSTFLLRSDAMASPRLTVGREL